MPGSEYKIPKNGDISRVPNFLFQVVPNGKLSINHFGTIGYLVFIHFISFKREGAKTQNIVFKIDIP